MRRIVVGLFGSFDAVVETTEEWTEFDFSLVEILTIQTGERMRS
jgi:hypothetical protein